MRSSLIALCFPLLLAFALQPIATADDSADQVTTGADTTLAAKLEEMSENSRQRMPAELIETFQAAVKKVKESGIETKAKGVGDRAIDARLSGWDGSEVQLSELWKQGPVVLMWYRGGWCPYCNVQLRAMQENLDKLQSSGARLVVLTPELPAKAKETAEKNDLDMVALHDKDNRVAEKYGLVFPLAESIVPMYRDRLKLGEYNGNDKMELPLSATYVINTDGKIAYAFLDADYTKRAEPADVLKAVKKL